MPRPPDEQLVIPVNHPSVAQPAFTMEHDAEQAPVMFHILCQPFADAAWAQWRLQQEPPVVCFLSRTYGNARMLTAITDVAQLPEGVKRLPLPEEVNT